MREVTWSAKQRVAVRTATLGIYGLVKLPRFEGMGPAETKAFGQGNERMERKTNTNGTEPKEPATLVGMSKVAVSTDTASPEAGGRVRRRLSFGAGWRFARHLLEMVVAMMAGIAVLGSGSRPSFSLNCRRIARFILSQVPSILHVLK